MSRSDYPVALHANSDYMWTCKLNFSKNKSISWVQVRCEENEKRCSLFLIIMIDFFHRECEVWQVRSPNLTFDENLAWLCPEERRRKASSRIGKKNGKHWDWRQLLAGEMEHWNPNFTVVKECKIDGITTANITSQLFAKAALKLIKLLKKLT